jgi:predicted ATP-grasp superfamily ATP-dependent carboligase
MKRPAAVVLGLSLNGIGVVRSLARKGIPIIGVCETPDEFGRHSRYCDRVCALSSQSGDAVERLQGLAQSDEAGTVLFPTSDDFVELVAKVAERSPDIVSAVSPKSPLDAILDKLAFAEMVDEIGLTTPITLPFRSLDELREALAACGGRAIVKPRLSHAYAARLGAKVEYLSPERPPEPLWERVAGFCDGLVVQEIVVDTFESIAVYLGYRSMDGRTLLGCTGRKIHQIPIEGGTAACVRIEPVPDLLGPSVRFLDAIDYRGVFGLEFKWDPARCAFSLLDVSARTELFHTAAWHAGLNLPHLAYLDCTGERIPGAIRPRRTCWIRVEHELAVIKRLLLGGSSVGDVLGRYRGRFCFPMADLRDPAPAMRYAGQTLARAWRRLRRGGG